MYTQGLLILKVYYALCILAVYYVYSKLTMFTQGLLYLLKVYYIYSRFTELHFLYSNYYVYSGLLGIIKVY